MSKTFGDIMYKKYQELTITSEKKYLIDKDNTLIKESLKEAFKEFNSLKDVENYISINNNDDINMLKTALLIAKANPHFCPIELDS